MRLSRLALASCLALVAPVLLPRIAAAQAEGIVVDGFVEIDGAPGWPDITIEFEVDGESCGSTSTDEGGTFSLTVMDPCVPGATVVAVLTQIDGRPGSEPIPMPEAVEATLSPRFSLTDGQIDELPNPPATADESAADTALRQQSESVFDEVEKLLIFLLIGGATLLAVMAIAMLLASRRRYDFMTASLDKLDTKDAKTIQAWSEAMAADGTVQQARIKVFRWMVEGLVMAFVVIALIALGAAGKVEAQGIVSVLAAMVGYAAGRAVT